MLSLYLLEGGKSSQRVLDALEDAGRSRSVKVTFGLDVSYVSAIIAISRFIRINATTIVKMMYL